MSEILDRTKQVVEYNNIIRQHVDGLTELTRKGGSELIIAALKF